MVHHPLHFRDRYPHQFLKQRREPDVVKDRPFWQHLQCDRRTPMVPRKQRLAWHNLILMRDPLPTQ